MDESFFTDSSDRIILHCYDLVGICDFDPLRQLFPAIFSRVLSISSPLPVRIISTRIPHAAIAPLTISIGALSPPIASTMIFNAYPSLSSQRFILQTLAFRMLSIIQRPLRNRHISVSFAANLLIQRFDNAEIDVYRLKIRFGTANIKKRPIAVSGKSTAAGSSPGCFDTGEAVGRRFHISSTPVI